MQDLLSPTLCGIPIGAFVDFKRLIGVLPTEFSFPPDQVICSASFSNNVFNIF